MIILIEVIQPLTHAWVLVLLYSSGVNEWCIDGWYGLYDRWMNDIYRCIDGASIILSYEPIHHHHIELPPISTSTSSISTCSERKLPEQVELYATVSSIACCRHNDKSNSNFTIMNYRDNFIHWNFKDKDTVTNTTPNIMLLNRGYHIDWRRHKADVVLFVFVRTYLNLYVLYVTYCSEYVFTMRTISISSSTNNASSKVIALNS
jgi:hypothetical protein